MLAVRSDALLCGLTVILAVGCQGNVTAAGSGGCPGAGLLTAQFGQTAATQACFVSTGGGTSGALTDTGNPTGSPQWLSVSLEFGDNDLLTGKLCSYAAGDLFPLTTGCIAISATWQGTNQWSGYAGQPNLSMEMDPTAPQPTGSLTIDEWPQASGGAISVTFSGDAALTSLDDGQAPSVLIPFSGSATGAP